MNLQTIKRDFALAFLMFLLSITANAYDFKVDGLCYNKNSDGVSVTVTYEETLNLSYSSLSGALTIPPSVTYDGITYSVTTIGNSAFSHCIGLTDITIPNSVTLIDGYSFAHCIGLTDITIPNSVTLIDGYSFAHCSGLKSVTLGNSVTTIRDGAFYECLALESMTFPNSVTLIDGDAFALCSGLKSVTFGNSVATIGDGAFGRCSGLTSITLPNSVSTIDNWAFSHCTSLTFVSIPNSVGYIGKGAFSHCTNLNRIESFADPAFVNLGTYVFEEVPKNKTLHVLPEYLDAYKKSWQWRDFTNIVGDLTEESGIEEVSINEFDRGLPMEVYNMNGVKVVNDLDDLSSGVYIVRQGNKTAKVIK